MPEEAFQIAEKREAKGKGEKERYTHLNAEFQRRARRDKKTLSEQCREIEDLKETLYYQGVYNPLISTVIRI